MYNLEKITTRLQELSEDSGDTFDIPVKMNNRFTSALGRLKMIKNSKGEITPTIIEFSTSAFATLEDADADQIVKHEWAHYSAVKRTGVNHGHDKYFKSICAEIGCVEDQTRSKHIIANEEKETKYTVYCTKCGKEVAKYSRRCKTLNNLNCVTSTCCGAPVELVQNW